jgi:hypothetical protein
MTPRVSICVPNLNFPVSSFPRTGHKASYHAKSLVNRSHAPTKMTSSPLRPIPPESAILSADSRVARLIARSVRSTWHSRVCSPKTVSIRNAPPHTVASAMKSHVQTSPRCVAFVGSPGKWSRRASLRLVRGTRKPSPRHSRCTCRWPIH